MCTANTSWYIFSWLVVGKGQERISERAKTPARRDVFDLRHVFFFGHILFTLYNIVLIARARGSPPTFAFRHPVRLPSTWINPKTTLTTRNYRFTGIQGNNRLGIREGSQIHLLHARERETIPLYKMNDASSINKNDIIWDSGMLVSSSTLIFFFPLSKIRYEGTKRLGECNNQWLRFFVRFFRITRCAFGIAGVA